MIAAAEMRASGPNIGESHPFVQRDPALLPQEETNASGKDVTITVCLCNLVALMLAAEIAATIGWDDRRNAPPSLRMAYRRVLWSIYKWIRLWRNRCIIF